MISRMDDEMSVGNYDIGSVTPAIVLKIDMLGKELEELAGAIDGLEARLHPVLKPESLIRADEVDTKQPSCSPLSEKLDDRLVNVSGMQSKIKSILARLEV